MVYGKMDEQTGMNQINPQIKSLNVKVYKLKSGILIEENDSFYLLNGHNWDEFVNDEELYQKSKKAISESQKVSNAADLLENELEPPIQSQELWASGVTYYNSSLARQEESKKSGGSDLYARVYQAERPELFFKATRHRIVGSGDEVTIRKDSTWNVPEPELTLMITSKGKIVGYTIGNDMSSRSIEGENPLYLPQAKTWDGSASIGPGLYLDKQPLSADHQIEMEILRDGNQVFFGDIGIDQMKRTLEELVSWLYRECSFPHGCLLMTGTGIIPDDDFTLHHGDEIRISIDSIGTLTNKVK